MIKSPAQSQSANKQRSSVSPEQIELLISDPETIKAIGSIRENIDKTIKATIQEKRRAKYLPKALDIVIGGLPSDDEIAMKKSERAWEKLDRSNAIKDYLSSVAIGPMSGQPIRIIEVSGDSNPDIIEVNVITHDGMSPEVAKEIGSLVKQTDEVT